MMTSRKKRKKRVEWFGQQLPLFNIGLWLALSLVGGLLPKASGGEAPGSITTTAYPSGVTCGTNPQVKCLTQATCSKFGVCNCPASTYGEGNFQCYPGNSIRAEVTSTTLKSFRNTSGKIIWPCRYRLTDFTTIRRNSGQKCHFKVFGSNQIIGGKVRISGFEVRMQLLEDSKEIGGIGIRKDGRAQNHVFTYTERGQNGFVNESPVTDEDMESSDDISTGSGSGDGGDDDDDEQSDDIAWGPPEELDIGNGERVVCKVDLDNFATVDVPSCGTRVSFRAASVDETQQDQVSGLSVSISQNNGPITFNNPETYLAETKKKDILRKGAKQKNISLNQEILHQAMAYAAKQYSTPEGRECEDTARTYRSYCRSDSQRANALKTCSFIMEDELFIACMDPSRGVPSSNSVSALRLCVWYTCSPSRTVCSVLQDRIQRKSCIHLTPPAFFARDCNA